MTEVATIPPEVVVEMAKELGEIRAELREIIHDKLNDSQRREAVARSLSHLEKIPEQLSKLSEDFHSEMREIKKRLTSLETDKAERAAQGRLWVLLLKSPAVGWAVGIVLAAVAYMTGKNA